MLNIALAPNALRGSLTALEAALAIQECLAASALACQCHLMPLADGGNGTLDVWHQATGAELITVTVHDPLGRPLSAEFSLKGDVALVEMARASGIELLADAERNPMLATTYGTGELIRAAIHHGAKIILVGVGGSATVDGGAGCLQALGASLFDKQGLPIGYGAVNLALLAQIDLQPALALLDGITLKVLCDVDNPLLGQRGAAVVFAPQKGASLADIPHLEANLTHYADLMVQASNIHLHQLAMTGAAGGLSGGLHAIGAELVSGAHILLEMCGYEAILAEGTIDLVITSEGKLDYQTSAGKAPYAMAQLARRYHIPVVALVGAAEVSSSEQTALGMNAVWSIVPRAASLDEALSHAAEWLAQAAYQLGNTLALGTGLG